MGQNTISEKAKHKIGINLCNSQAGLELRGRRIKSVITQDPPLRNRNTAHTDPHNQAELGL